MEKTINYLTIVLIAAITFVFTVFYMIVVWRYRETKLIMNLITLGYYIIVFIGLYFIEKYREKTLIRTLEATQYEVVNAISDRRRVIYIILAGTTGVVLIILSFIYSPIAWYLVSFTFLLFLEVAESRIIITDNAVAYSNKVLWYEKIDKCKADNEVLMSQLILRIGDNEVRINCRNRSLSNAIENYFKERKQKA